MSLGCFDTIRQEHPKVRLKTSYNNSEEMLPLERSAAELNAQPSLMVDNQLAFAFAC
jgi:hypothetical protein